MMSATDNEDSVMAEPKKSGSLLGKLFKAFVLLVLLAVAGVMGVTFFVLDGKYEVSRSVTVKADMDDVHAMCGELKNWPKWQPWTREDPTISTTIVKDTGVGAHQHWTGKDGNGKVTFTSCDPEKGVEYDMAFDDKYFSKGAITYSDAGGGMVQVTWAMHGRNEDFIGKWFAVAMPGMIGPYFERGLNDLKTALEK